MKKIIALIFVAVMSLTIVACGNKEYKVDGEFTAFEVSYNREVPMITWVTVTIEKGKVTKYFIDAKQAEVNEAGEFVWNAKSKKELKYDYNMKDVSEIGKEWFEQAEALEAFMLEKGPEAVTTKDGYIDNVTGVSVKDGGYTKLAKEALANAKANKFLAFELGYTSAKGPQVTWSIVTTDNKGKVTEIFLDCLQSDKSTANDTVKFTWKAKTKKELKFDYNMKPVSGIGKEWFEQAEALEKFMLEKGVDAVTTKDGVIDNVTGVSIKDGGYTALTKAAIALIKK